MLAPPILTDTTPAGMRRAIQADLEATTARRTEIPGATAVVRPDLVMCATDVPLVQRNVVARSVFDAAVADERNTDVAAGFRDRGVPFEWWVGPFDEPADLAKRLEAIGCRLDCEVPGMALDLDALVVGRGLPGGGGVTVEPVLDAAGLDLHLATIRATAEEEFDDPPEAVAILHEAIRAEGRIRGYTNAGVPIRWLGRLDGRPVGTGRLSLDGGVAGIYAMTTIPAARRRGVGGAVLGAMLDAARAAGFRIAVLQATELGEPVYRRAGFETYSRYLIYQWELNP